MISLSGLLFHRSAFWLVTAVAAVALYFAVQFLMDARISARSLEQARREFLNSGSGFTLEVIDDAAFFRREDFPHIFDNRQRLRAMLGDARFAESSKDNPWMWEGHPLKAFVATSRGGALVGGAKAYTNPAPGASLVFLSKVPNLLNATQRFVLMHELEHVSVRGAAQLTYMHASRIWGLLGVIFVCFSASSWFHWLGVTVYAIECVLLKCWYTMPILREVIADNGGLRKLTTPEEQRQVAEDLLRMFRDHIEARRPTRPGDTFMPFMRHAELTWRIGYLEGFLERLARGEAAPRLDFLQTTSRPYLVLYALLFAHVGAVTPQPPLVPVFLVAACVVVAILAAVSAAGRASLANRAVQEYVSSHVAKPGEEPGVRT